MWLLRNFLNLFAKTSRKIRRISERKFIFDGFDSLYYDLNKISLNRGGSYTNSLEWLKTKKATIKPQNEKDDKCFQYGLTVALNHKQI